MTVTPEIIILVAVVGLGAVLVFWFRDDIARIRRFKIGPLEIEASAREGRRLQKIEEWRDAVHQFDWDEGHFYNDPAWSEMRAHLPDEFVSDFESGITLRPVITSGREHPSDKQRILDELGKLEKKWMEGANEDLSETEPDEAGDTS